MGTRRSKTPGGERSSPVDAVMQLMAERQKYEQWIDDLDAKKDSTPAKVFDKVRHDYLERLQSVIDQLKEHTGAMEEHAESLSDRLKELEDSEDEIAEKLAESELRAKVGEITQAEWETMSRKAQREITKLKESQLEVAGDLNRIKDLLGGADKKAAEKRTTAEINEMDFLKSVVGSTPAAEAPAPAAPPRTSAPTPTQSAPTPTSTPAQTPPSQPVQPAAEKPAAPAAAKAKPTPSTVPTTSGPLAKAQIPDQNKTLKCPECGSMNYPTEWYCERCGAELTVG